MDPRHAEHLLACCTGDDSAFEGAAWALGARSDSDRLSQLLALRGMLAFGVLEHCLGLRHLVDYGVNPKCVPLSVALARAAAGAHCS